MTDAEPNNIVGSAERNNDRLLLLIRVKIQQKTSRGQCNLADSAAVEHV